MEKQTKYLAKTFAARTTPLLRHAKVSPVKVVAVVRGIKHMTLKLHLSNATDHLKILQDSFIESVALTCNLQHVSAYREGGLIGLSYSLPPQFHAECLYKDLHDAGIGIAEGNAQCNIEFPDYGAHCLIASATGGGKNVTAAAMLLSLLRTEPDIQLVLIDPHQQFLPFSNVTNLMQPIAGSMDVDVDRNLTYVYQEYLRRQAQYPGGAPDSVPRMVLVIDEAEQLISTGARATMLATLGSGARKYRINLIIIAQKPTIKSIGPVLNNLTQRWVGLVANKRISSDLLGQAGELSNCHKLLGDGDFMQLLRGQVTRVQIGNVLDSDYAYLERGEKTFPIPQPLSGITSPPPVEASAENRSVGRPKREIEPILLAQYMLDDSLTYAFAKQSLGISQAGHRQYRAFARLLKEAIQNLKTGNGGA